MDKEMDTFLEVEPVEIISDLDMGAERKAGIKNDMGASLKKVGR